MNNTELQQRLLEWHYGLLSDSEAAELQHIIESSPDAAQVATEAREMADKLAGAARLSAAVSLSSPDACDANTGSRASEERVPKQSLGTSGASPAGATQGESVLRRRILKTLLALTFLWLVGLVGGNWWIDHQGRLADSVPTVPQPGLRLMAKERTDVVGTQSTIDFEALDERGQPKTVNFKAEVVGNGHSLFSSDIATDRFGHANLVLPASLKLPSDAKIMFACATDSLPRVSGELKLTGTKFITQLSFDKLLYRPGEVVRFRSLTVERFNMKPGEKQVVHYKVLDPSGATIAEATQGTAIGVAAFEWPIPGSQVGGTYTVECHSTEGFFPTQKKTFHIQQYRAPKFKKDLVFAKDSYGPGDVVKADFSALRAEGGIPKNARLTVAATVDGQNVFNNQLVLSDAGTLAVQFPLPVAISTGDGRLSITIDDGANRETLTRTIPIQLNRIDLVFYPESGDIVSGLENRVYFVARNPQGKPVHVAGRIVNRSGRTVTETETLYDGMGSFTFTPAFGEQYRVQLTQPTSTTAEFNLPLPKDEQLAVLSGGRGVFEPGEPLDLTVWAKTSLPRLMIAAHCRGTFVGREMISAEPGSNSVTLGLLDQAYGVIRVTVWDASQTPAKPLAERLVYRKSNRELRIDVVRHGTNATNGTNENATTHLRPSRAIGPMSDLGEPDAFRFAPGEHAKLKLKVTNERGEPVAAALGIAVVDDAVISLTDDEHKEASLKTHLLVSSEIDSPEDIEDVEFYLAAGAKSEAALDHLLGTQGWRRFIEKRYDEVLKDIAQKELLEKLNRLECRIVDPNPVSVSASLPTVIREVVDRAQLGKLFGQVSMAVGMVLGFCLVVTLLSQPVQTRWAAMTAARSSSGNVGTVGGLKETLPYGGSSRPVGPRISRVKLVVVFWCSLVGIAALIVFALLLANSQGPQHALNYFDMAKTGAAPMASAKMDVYVPRTGVGSGIFDDIDDGDCKGVSFPTVGGKDDPSGDEDEVMTAPVASAPGAVPSEGAGPPTDAIEERVKGFRFVPQRASQTPAKNGAAGAAFGDSRVILREYAHKHRERKSPDEERSDFTETLFWNPLVIADRNGEATIEFDLSDSVTTFRVLADAHAVDGRIGTGRGELASRLPFHIEPKLPLEVTAGDRIDLPVAVVNDSANAVSAKVTLASSPLFHRIGAAEQTLSVEAHQRTREYFAIEVTGEKGDAEVKLSGVAGTHTDRVKRSIKVVPTGFPVSHSQSGMLKEGNQAVSLKLPDAWTPGSLNVTFRAFPTPAADVLQGLEGMLQEPCGCFEQTTSSNYPNVLVLRYLQSNGLARPDITTRAKSLLANGYSRLVGYESKSGGFEWFGGDPGHEALTAFGLMEFVDMQPVFTVDSAMLARTTKWLLSRRNGKGGFERNPRHLHTWAVRQDLVDAYVVWALTETRQQDVLNQLSLELQHVRSLGENTNDPYVLALAALSLTNAGQTQAADALLDKLAGQQGSDGKLSGHESITQSGGTSLWVESTALAALAWQKRPAFATQAERAVGWIRSQRAGSGHFGSTQATVLALKALLGTVSNTDPGSTSGNGAIVIRSGNEVLSQVTFATAQLEPITLSNFASKLKPGENVLTCSMTDGRPMAFTIDTSFRTARPDNDGKCPVVITTKLASEKLAAGAVTTLEAKITNTKREGLPMTLAILGVPAGLEVRTAQLDELKDKGVIDYFELRGREVICYWRTLDPEKVIDLKLDVTAEIPGTYTGPASQCYLYYTAEQKHWSDPLKVSIAK